MSRRLSTLVAICLVIPVWGRTEEVVRVRIAAGLRQVELSGPGLRLDGHPVKRGHARAEVRDGRIRWSGGVGVGAVAVRASGPLSVNGHAYPGAIALVPGAPGRMDVVNRVPLEAYVAATVAREIYADWPLETLKAQAVVSRTYGLHERARRRGESFDLEASVLSQRYTAGVVPVRVAGATQDTGGEYLAFDGLPILAAFHAAAGGRTADSEEVWVDRLPYLRSVASPDDSAPDHFWSYDIAYDDLLAALRQGGIAVRPGAVDVLDRGRSGRVQSVRIGDAVIQGRSLRRILGGRGLRSTLFDIRIEGGRVLFLGSGSGHGVGLSQWGARELALQGRTYREILAHYYLDTEIMRLGGTETASTRWSTR